jgi:hypothetical protein
LDHPNIPKSCRIERFEGAGTAFPFVVSSSGWL